MNTLTPRTDAAWSATFDGQQMSAGKTARTLREHSQQLEAELAAVAAALTTLTCTHHNDKQRAECPVCLVATLTDEIKRLKRDYDYNHRCLHEVRERCESWKQRAEKAEKQFRILKETLDHVTNMYDCAMIRAERAEAFLRTIGKWEGAK